MPEQRVRVTFDLLVTDEEDLRSFSTEEFKHVQNFDAETVEAVAARVFINESINNIQFESAGLDATFVAATLPDGTPIIPATPGDPKEG